MDQHDDRCAPRVASHILECTDRDEDLMSGSNGNMSAVTTVASGLDGTNSTLSPYNWTCPEVDPYSAIYFYQVRCPINIE